MNALITGANGYIGGFLKAELNSRGIRYVCAARSDFDYTDQESIERFFSGINADTVIHLAGVVESGNSADFYDINLLGLRNLLQVSADNNVRRFIMASTNNVYGTYKETAYSETDELLVNSSNKYGFSKYLGEHIIRDMCGVNGMEYANVRIADVYGPGQKYGNLIKAIVSNVKAGKPLSLYGEGVRTRDYIYVKDVAAGLAFISQSDFCGEINLGTGTGTSVKQMLDIVNKIYDDTLEIKKVSVENEDRTCVVLNVDRLSDLGFKAEYSVEEGMRETTGGGIN